MNRRTWNWHSPSLDREMGLGCWGHFGTPVLLFSTAAADYLDYERFKMMVVLRPLIEAGRIKVYSCDSISGDGWLNKDAHPAHKTWLQGQFDRYLIEELLPFIADDCGGSRDIIAAGSSLGAYNAVTAAAKHPGWFQAVVAMSGTYYFERWVGEHRDTNFYFNQPIHFVPNMKDGPLLEALRQVRFVIATGTGKWEAPDESRKLAGVLRSKGVPVDLELWGRDADHDWPTWRTMLPMFLDKLVA
jgi:esterase/lipase superfamily enzyme